MGPYSSLSAQRRKDEKLNEIITLVVVSILVLACSLTTFFVFFSRTEYNKVTAAQSIATTNIRQKTLAHREDWCPPDEESAFNIKRERRLYRTYKCHCHTFGGDENGFGGVEVCSECKDYRDYCVYDIMHGQ